MDKDLSGSEHNIIMNANFRFFFTPLINLSNFAQAQLFLKYLHTQ